MDWLQPIEQHLAIMASLPPNAEEPAGPADILAQDCRKLMAAVRLAEHHIVRIRERMFLKTRQTTSMSLTLLAARLRSGDVEKK